MSEEKISLVDHHTKVDPTTNFQSSNILQEHPQTPKGDIERVSNTPIILEIKENSIQEIEFKKKWTLSISSKSKNSFHPYKIDSEEASAPQLKFVHNYAKLDLDNLINKKIGPYGYHLKLLLAQASFSILMCH